MYNTAMLFLLVGVSFKSVFSLNSCIMNISEDVEMSLFRNEIESYKNVTYLWRCYFITQSMKSI